MSLLENVKRITEKATGWKRPDDPEDLLRQRAKSADGRHTEGARFDCLSREEFAQYLEGRRNQRRGKHSMPRRRIPRMRALAAGSKKASLAVRRRKSVAS
jgi:hypothetical protein